MGLDQTARISQIVIHPTDPNIVYVASMGHCYGPQQERGVYRTLDSGKHWERVLFVDGNTGASDLAIDPNNPHIVFAGMWQVELRPWNLNSGGPGSGLYVSRDGGTTWKHLTGHGLPEPPLGRIGIAIAPSNSNRVQAVSANCLHDSWAGIRRGRTRSPFSRPPEKRSSQPDQGGRAGDGRHANQRPQNPFGVRTVQHRKRAGPPRGSAQTGNLRVRED
jgi:hypothetical protein